MKNPLKRWGPAIVLGATMAMPLGMSAKFNDVANDDDIQSRDSDTHLTLAPSDKAGYSGKSYSYVEQDDYITYDAMAASRPDEGREIIASGGWKRSAASVLGKFRTASSVEDACLADSLESLIRDVRREEGLTRTGAAIRIINALSPEQIKDMPNLARADLIAAINVNEDLSVDTYLAIRKVYINSPEDTYFSRWDAKKQYELSKVLRDDPELMSARQNWDTMQQDEKLHALRRVVDHTIRTYGAEFGITPVPLDFKNHPDPNRYGYYKPGERRMYLNPNSNRIPEDFELTAMVTVHEALHAFHHQLIDRMKAGKIDRDHDVYNYARFMEESYFRYIRAPYDRRAYVNNPTEKHAWEIEYIGAYIGRGSSKPLTRALGNMNMAERNHQEHLQDREQEVRRARTEGLYCSEAKLTQRRKAEP